MKPVAAMVSMILLSVLVFSLITSISVGATDAGWSSAQDINDVGQVVGQRFFVAGVAHAFLWQSGTFKDLGTIEGVEGASVAFGINNLGQVVGQSSDKAGGIHHAFLWPSPDTGSGMKDLGTLGGASSTAWGINDAGQIVGDSETASGAKHAFVWANGAMMDLGLLPGASASAYSLGWHINRFGQISGHATTASGMTHGVVWKPQSGGTYTITDLGALSGGYSAGRGINETGSIVGYASIATQGRFGTSVNHAVLWTPRGDGSYAITDLGSLGGSTAVGVDINGFGQVAGWGDVSSKGTLHMHAFIWTRGTGLVDLGTLPGGCCSAGLAINEAGTIAGWGITLSGTSHAVLWIKGAIKDLETG